MIKKNIIANYFGQGWTALMGFAFIPLYIKYLGIEAYGLIGFFSVMQASLSLLDMGMPATLNREMARFKAGVLTAKAIRNLLRSLEIICLVMAFLIFGSGLGLSGIVAGNWFKVGGLSTEEIKQAIAAMSLVIALRFCEGIYRNALLGLQRQVLYNVVNSIMVTLRSIGAVAVLILVSPKIQVFFYWQAIVSLLTLIAFATSVYCLLPSSSTLIRFSFSSLSHIWKFAAGMMATSILAFLLTQVDKILLSKLLPLTELGYYSIAGSIAALLGLIVTPISQSFYPRLMELHAQGKETQLISNYHQSAQLVTLIAAPVAALLVFHAQGIIYLWSSDMVLAEKTAPIVALLVTGAFLNGLMVMPWILQLAYGWSSFAAKVNTIAIVILIPSLFWVVPHFGTKGAAMVWVALNASYVFIAIHFMHHRLIPDEKWKWYISDVLFPVSGALFVVLGMLMFQPKYLESRIFFLLYLVGVGILSLATASLMANRIKPQIIDILKIAFKRQPYIQL